MDGELYVAAAFRAGETGAVTKAELLLSPQQFLPFDKQLIVGLNLSL